MLDLEKVHLGGTKSCFRHHDFSPVKRKPDLFPEDDVDMLDESQGISQNENLWVTINTCNKMGRKATINRCLLYPLSPYSQECDQFLVLGCHFGRSEAPFVYDTTKNKYLKF